ncbi:MAG TPA: patatin-like phospholipase family protein [Thermoanaerobaculia bacterium]|nr:patatin-like phospholipase family protein [Thermoanaerobaculia bacterium]
MIEVVSALPVSVDFAADPLVVELRGKPRGGADLHFDVHGVPRLDELAIEVLPIEPVDGFRFEAGAPKPRRSVESPSEPVRVTVPVRCFADGAETGDEAATELRVRLRLGGGPDAPAAEFAVGLVASADRVLPLWEVLREEYVELARDPEWKAALAGDPVLADPDKSDREKTAHLFSRVHRLDPGLAALCFSGGGIRSATFNLGVLQGLVDAGLMDKVDYLSSVSGGGYVASWIHGWLHRAGGIDKVAPYLEQPESGAGVNVLDPEPYPLRFLRSYSNYLTPRLGVLSPDTWTLVATVVRNLILNWLVFLPILAAALTLPLVALSRDEWARQPELVPWLYGAALLFGTVGLFFMSALRASADPKERSHRSDWDQWFLRLGLLPLLAATVALAWGSAIYLAGGDRGFVEVLPWCAIWALGVPLVAFLAAELLSRRLDRPRPSLFADLLAVIAAGVPATLLYAHVLSSWADALLESPYLLYPLLAPFLVLGPVLLTKSLFVAFSSLSEEYGYPSELGDADREWWARWSAWTLIVSVVTMAGSALVFYAPTLLSSTVERLVALASAGGLGGLVSQLGKSAGSDSRLKKVVLAFAAPLFVVLLLILVSVGAQEILGAVFPEGEATAAAAAATAPGAAFWIWVPPFRGELWQVAAAIAVFAGVGLLFGRFVEVNRFSLQAMYRNRLVRAYLGASNPLRRPNLFTGFDANDDLRLHRLRANRPWPVINMALNLVHGEELAWQERKAESFTATPLHCGSARLGYRRAQAYGGEGGLSLGTAIATSGAAASPNMGYHSSPSTAFIMALLNARLGAWLGNPGPAGSRTYTRSGPASSAALLVAEALGQTDDTRPYVYLSDGGHFENLGLYEMVRRRCRTIIVCDAGCDPTYAFDDLGSAIRKVRIDLGVPIEFERRIAIYPKPVDQPKPGASYCAIGRIDYSAVDGADAAPGFLLYVKPAIIDREPYDVTNYARRSMEFPHESTVDQWFSESQFESYRALGKNVVATVLGRPSGAAPLDLDELMNRVEAYLQPPAPAPAPSPGPAPVKRSRKEKAA